MSDLFYRRRKGQKHTIKFYTLYVSGISCLIGPIQSALSKNLKIIKKHGKEHDIIKVGTLGGHHTLCLKSYRIRNFMISENQQSLRHKAKSK